MVSVRSKLALFLLLLIPPVFAENFYIAQSSAGGDTGVDCSNAKALTFFNTSGNWGAGAGQIGPGDTVHLCGTFTFSAGATGLAAQGSGSSGQPITILFESGATLQAPDFGTGGAAIRLDNHDYITVDGGGTGDAKLGTFVPNGTIQATLSGTSGAACIGGPCTQNNGSTGISAETTNHIVIKNLRIIDMYLRTDSADQAPDWATYFCIHASISNNLLILNNYLDQSGEIIAPNGDNIEISHNYIANTNHGISLGAASTSYSNTYIHDNQFGDMDSWDAGSPFPYHHDGIHVFPAGPGYYLSLFIYNNLFTGDLGASAPTGWIYMEADCCTGGAVWVFNNYATSTPYRSAPAMFGIYGASTINFANNTVATTSYTGGGVGCDLGLTGDTINLAQNNICGTQSYGWNVQNGTSINGAGAMDYNSYVNGFGQSGNGGSMNYGGVNTDSLTTYRTTTIAGATHDANSQLQLLADYKLNSDGTLQSGSLAIGAGANLYSTCNGQPVPGLGALCSDNAGTSRPSSGPWDAGAFQSSAGTPPTVLRFDGKAPTIGGRIQF